MSKNLLIVGAGMYSIIAYEIAVEMGCFEKIDFIDDMRKVSLNGMNVVGTTDDLNKLEACYSHIAVAIGNTEVRLSLLNKIKEKTGLVIASLISPRAYVSPSAKITNGCIIEPMSVVHTNCEIAFGCIISAGAVVNHSAVCCDGVHVDCNATVCGYCFVPSRTKVASGEVYNTTRSV